MVETITCSEDRSLNYGLAGSRRYLLTYVEHSAGMVAARGKKFPLLGRSPVRGEDLSARSNASFAKRPPKVRARTPDTAHAASVERKSAMTTRKMDDKDIERMIDIIGDGELSAEAQERLQQEGLWPLYESVRQMAYTAFVFGHPNG